MPRMARIAPELAADWPTYRDLDGTLAGVAARRENVSEVWAWLGSYEVARGYAADLFDDAQVAAVPSSSSTPLTSSTLCWAPCRSGRDCHPDSATLSPPRTTPSTSGSVGRSARAPSPAWLSAARALHLSS